MKKGLLLLFLFLINTFAYSGDTLVSNSSFIGGVSINITTPNQISDLVLWLDADDSSTITPNGNQVSVWADKSGLNNNATQGTSSLQPIFDGPLLGGRVVLRFDGSNDFMFLPTAATFGIDNSDYEMLIVFRSASSAVQFLIAGFTGGNYELHLNLIPFGNAALRFIPIPSQFSDIGSDGDLTNNIGHIAGARINNNIAIVRADGIDTLDTETPARSSDTGIMRLGIRAGEAFLLNGDIAEIILFKRALLSSERLGLEQYLNNKWGIN